MTTSNHTIFNPNVDFYSGIIFFIMGIPLNMFTVLFAMAQTIGWVSSQWNEMMADPTMKVGRQRYTGHPTRPLPCKNSTGGK